VVAIYGIGGERLSRRNISLEYIASLLRQSWPLLLSSMAVVVYMRIDQVMIAMLANTYEVGIYSAAVRISEVWYFVPGAIVASIFPVLLAQRQSDKAGYERNLQYLYTAVVAVSLVVALVAMLGSDWAVEALFGSEFSAAAPILMVHIWAGLFVALGVTSGRWLIAEGLQRMASYRTLYGAFINVGLNYILIPRLGALGAAVATVVSYSIAAFWSDVLFQSTRRVFLMKLRAILLLDLGSLAAQLARLVGAAARN
jgi:PST family polysaccharide transporter